MTNQQIGLHGFDKDALASLTPDSTIGAVSRSLAEERC